MNAVITGMGVVSPIGNDVDGFWSALCSGVSGIRPIRQFDVSPFAYKQGGEVSGFDARERAATGPEPGDRATRILLAATSEAMDDAGFQAGTDIVEDAGVVVATNFGGIHAAEAMIAAAVAGEPISGATLDEYSFQHAADRVAAPWNLAGPRSALSLSCASGTAAIGAAIELIRHGRAGVVVAAGYDALSEFVWSGLSALRTMTKDRLRPFDANRGGTIFSEGAGVLVLEEEKRARARGATVYARAAGYALNNNAYHMTAPDKDGAGTAAVMAAAVADAGLRAEEIDHVNAHASGTPYNDRTETRAIKDVLGDRARRVPVTGNKSMTGHAMGAAGSLEAIASVLALRDGLIPPTINYETPDPECDLDYTVGEARRVELRAVLSNSAGIGGCNAAAVFTRA